MRSTVLEAFIPFTIPLEGARPDYVGVPWMYQDVLGLVSTGLGNLIDPIGLALTIPFKRADGSLATKDEVVAEWNRIKNQPPDEKGRTAAQLGHLYARKIATLHLTNDDILNLIRMRLYSNERIIAGHFPQWDQWPADAQLATHSMAWACGAGIFDPKANRAFWPKLTAALHNQDFKTASVECFMPQENKIGGLRPRNKANRILYMNAALNKDSPEVLIYPKALEESGPLSIHHPEVVVDFQKVYAPVPLGRPSLDGDLPTTPSSDEEDNS